MDEPQNEISSVDKEIFGIKDLHRFRHAAMAAIFEVFVVHRDALYAEQAAWAAFEELDRIENNLSRFIANSDISRINAIGRGQPLQIGPSAFECLLTSIEMSAKTKGAFDITFGSLHRGGNPLKLNESDHTIDLDADGVRIDLGAIGKGYAADKMAQLLSQWSIDTALISAGQSTILPIGTPPGMVGWPVTMSDPTDYSQVLVKTHLAGRALSASGIRKGSHIINPRSGKPAKDILAAWSMAQTGAMADALSTAFMVMSVSEVRAYCAANIETSAFLVLPGKKKGTNIRIMKFGGWGKIISQP